MELILDTLEVSQLPMSWLIAVAEENMLPILVTAEVSQELIS